MPRYILYARKSEENEDRQVLSIDSQVRELTDHARSAGLEIADVFCEAQSAKAPGRPVFAKILRGISKREVRGILCWKLDRLARNPVDGGALIWAFDEERLTEIVTPQRTFTNTGNDKFWMQLEFGMAKKYVDDLSENVRRGNRAKLEQGWLPGIPPVGYQNDFATKTILPDPDRFPLVRKMWELALEGTPLTKIREIANGSWGFRTRMFKRHGGKPLARNSLYKLFANSFYYGLIVRNRNSYVGAHEPMVTKDEFDEVQRLLGRPNREPRTKRAFPFTGIMRCGECGSAITAEEQVNRYGAHYTYYRCSKRKEYVSCSQPYIRAEAVEEQIRDSLSRIEVTPSVRRWALSYRHEIHAREIESAEASKRSLEESLAATTKKLSGLTDLRIRGLLTDEEFKTKRQELLDEKIHLENARKAGLEGQTAWLEPWRRTFTFAFEARRLFDTGSSGEKRAILLALGSNFLLRNKTLEITPKEPFSWIEEGNRRFSDLLRNLAPLELAKAPVLPIQIGRLPAVISPWCAIGDRIRTFFQKHPHSIQWPDFCKDVRVIRHLNNRSPARQRRQPGSTRRHRRPEVQHGKHS